MPSPTPTQINWHKYSNSKTYVTFKRPAIGNNNEKFWRQHKYQERTLIKDIDSFESLRQWADEGQQAMPTRQQLDEWTQHKVFYFDLQKGFPFREDTEERVCLCSEWCNWTAFFHYNPIYRFIVVQNSQLFFKFAGNVPEIYLFDIAELLSKASNIPLNAMAFPLLHSANEYHNKNMRTYRKNKNFRRLYQNSYPNPVHTSGVAYNWIRYDLPIAQILHRLESNPSGDMWIRGLNQYNDLLYKLHYYCTLFDTLVLNDMKWMNEYTSVIHSKITQILPITYDSLLGQQSAATDRLFSSDLEYLSFVATNADEYQIKYLRAKAFQYGSTLNVVHRPEQTIGPNQQVVRSTGQQVRSYHNPLNVKVSLSPFANALIWVYKFFSQVISRLTIPNTYESVKAVNDGFSKLDRDFFDRYNNLSQQVKNNLFEVTVRELVANRVPIPKRQHVYVLYTLKLYSFVYVVLDHCIKARNQLFEEHMKKDVKAPGQFGDMLRFFRLYSALEQPFRQMSANAKLFSISYDMTQMIDDFYLTFWGRAPHELNVPQNPVLIDCVTSAFNQYKKQFVWIKNGGNTKKKFKALLEVYVQQLNQNLVNGQEIETNYLVPIYEQLSDDQHRAYDIETMDVIYLYLVRAICHIHLSTALTFTQRLLATIDSPPVLNRYDRGYQMCKPGWTQIFDSIRSAQDQFYQLRQRYIVFDDETERLGQTLDNSRNSIKAIYRGYYYKISKQWIEELSKMSYYIRQTARTGLTNADSQIVGSLMQLQLIFGLVCTTKFHAVFRTTFSVLRKGIQQSFRSAIGKVLHVQLYKACVTPMDEYLRNFANLRQKEVHECKIWTDFLGQHIPDLLTLQPNDVGLDMAVADT